MKKTLLSLAFLAGTSISLFAQDFRLTNPEVQQATLIRVTPPLKEIPTDNPPMGPNFRQENRGEQTRPVIPLHPAINPNALPVGKDPALQLQYNEAADVANRTLSLANQFAGLGFTGVNPSDNNLASGPNHIVQMINNSSSSFIRIWNKAGTILVNQQLLSTITGVTGGGDPIVLYDQIADRWLLSEFGNGTNRIYIAVSQTADPTGGYFVYTFTTPQFPDYFKVGAWPGSYIITSNENAPAVYAIDRTRMLAGAATATIQRFTLPAFPTIGFQAAAPVDISGNTAPPAGSPALIMRMADDAWTTGINDRLEIFSFNVDWVNTANTTLTGPLLLNTAPFSTNLCGFTTLSCIPQQGSTVRLDPLREVLMNKVSYRNFGTHEAIVCNHVTNVNTSTVQAGVRWYELRKSGATPWNIYQQGTYAPDALNRWMAGIAINADGAIGLAYNVSGTTAFPSIRLTGRKACDPLGTMPEPEQTVIAGTAANSSSRYGDYNSMTVDPVNGSFWFTGQFNTSANWSTRVANFSISACTTVACTTPTNVVTSNVTSSSVQVNWTASGATSYRVEYQLPTDANWTVAGTTAGTSFTVNGLAASTFYIFRVAALCAGGDLFSSATNATTAPVCNTPGSLSSSGVTSSGATVNWAAVSGASSYTVEYKPTTATAWITAAAAATTTSVTISGLAAGTTYDWRVRTNCSVGSSAFNQAQFTTTAAVSCVTAFEPNETQATASNISTNLTYAAAISTATDVDYYRVTTTATSNFSVTLTNLPGDYDLYFYNSAGTLIGSSEAGSTTNELITLNNQPAGTYFVRVIGFNGASSTTVCYNLRVGATAITTGCQSSLDNSTNGTISGAATIPFNANITGLINPTGDLDHYRFVITTGGTITITLGTLPADFDLRLLNSAGSQVAISQNGSTTGETINFTAAPGTYYAQVYGYNGASSATVCYTLRVQLGTARALDVAPVSKGEGSVQLYPNPVSDLLKVSVLGKLDKNSLLQITDGKGAVVMQQRLINNPEAVDVSKLAKGIYLLTINTGGQLITAKFVKE
jgi:Bacterial pre-peptidase C-terminal domain/Secretion system C-terminal sorting domain/Fibronectin type III domain